MRKAIENLERTRTHISRRALLGVVQRPRLALPLAQNIFYDALMAEIRRTDRHCSL
jgi:hypothetical protein